MGGIFITKNDFNKLTTLEQINFVNSQLENNKSITSICKELEIGRSTIRERFKKHNYSYSKESNRYIAVSDNLDSINNKCITSDTYNKDNPLVTILEKSDTEIQKNIIDLVNNYDVLKEIIELHKCNTSVIKNQIIINLDDKGSKLTTLRINKTTLDDFNKFCEKNNQFTKIDLVSQALKDFMDTHS